MRISDWSSDVCSSDLAGLRSELQKSRQLRARADQARASLVPSRRALADRRAQLRQLEVRKRVASRAPTSNANLEADRAIALGEKALDIVALMDLLRVSGTVREEMAQLPGPDLRPPRPVPAALTHAEEVSANYQPEESQ